jgi:hypothetical protein
MVVDEMEKAQVIFDHFDAILGSYVDRTCTLEFGLLNVLTVDLTRLDYCFSEDEIEKPSGQCLGLIVMSH